jgi:hypothetical protein
MGKMRNAYRILTEREWTTQNLDERITYMEFRKTGWEGVNWMHLAQERDQW